MRIPSTSDLAIFGAGPAALTCGLAGLANGMTVVLFGSRREGARTPAGEHIAPEGRAALERLAVPLPAGIVRDCTRIEAHWGTGKPRFADYLFSPRGNGLNVLRPAFDQVLLGAFVDRGGRLGPSGRLREIARERGCFEVRFKGAPAIRAVWLIDATGRACALARRFGAKPLAYDRMIGYVGDVDSHVCAGAALVVEANPHGWCYMVGLAEGGARVVALTDGDLVPRVGGADYVWNQLVSTTPKLQAFAQARPRRVEVVPARTQRLDRPGGENWLAVGDAAMTFDPLSSEGIAKALEDGPDAIAAIAGGQTTLERRAARNAHRFHAYCREHVAHYRLERRWPERPFWRRRHSGPLGTRPIELDPGLLVQRADPDARDGSGSREIGFPLVNPEPIREMARRPLPAHVLVRAIREIAALRALTDRERIGLVQALLSTGDLRPVARPPTP